MRIVSAALLIALFGASPALADREPNADERARIETVLRSEGFQRWEEIELEGDRWEVDDAVAADGKEYDLTLGPRTFAIIGREPD
jgi:hypothetical protein